MEGGFLSFLEAIRRGHGLVDADYAGWLLPRDDHELAILSAHGDERVRLAGWVRDDLSDHIADVISKTTSAKTRARFAELARYYLRPVGPKDPAATRATLSNWRREGAERLADQLRAPHTTSLTLRLQGLPEKGERLSLDVLARDPALGWIMCLKAQERDVSLYRALADAASEAKTKGDARTLIGVALLAARLAPGSNPEPMYDFDGTPLRGLDGRKFTRSRLAAPLVLFCAHRAALRAHQDGRGIDTRSSLISGCRLVDSISGPPQNPGPLTILDEEAQFDPDLFAYGIRYAWQMISTNDAQPLLSTLTRHAALASGMVGDDQRQSLALLSIAVARRHSDRRALDIELHHPSFRSDSADSILFQLRFRRERLMLASHHDPGRDWSRELTGMGDLLTVRRSLLAAADARHLEKVQLHLQQGIHLRRAREVAATGQPMDTIPTSLTGADILNAIGAVDSIVRSLRDSFRIAEEDADEITIVNAHRRKTEAEGVVHLLSRVAHPDALTGARRLQRDLNKLDDICFDEHTGLRPDVSVLWLLATADQALRRNETEQAKHYVTTAINALPEGIPHLAIRSANIAAAVGDIAGARRLLDRVPQHHTWPSYLRELVGRTRSRES
jgi:hypothetical protein